MRGTHVAGVDMRALGESKSASPEAGLAVLKATAQAANWTFMMDGFYACPGMPHSLLAQFQTGCLGSSATGPTAKGLKVTTLVVCPQ